MSDTEPTTTSAADKPAFSEKEQKLLMIAMMSLKSGPPEIDMAKFKDAGEFNTLKTAQNTWGKIKSKLIQLTPQSENGDADPTTPGKTPKATPKKRGSKAVANEDAEGGTSPAKKPRKTPVKKAAKKEPVKQESESDGVEDGAEDETA